METTRPARGVLFVRCPEELRERIAAVAKRNLRTIGAETIYRLEQSLKQTATDEAAA